MTGYDKMGNILGLKRYGQTSSTGYDVIDDCLLYTSLRAGNSVPCTFWKETVLQRITAAMWSMKMEYLDVYKRQSGKYKGKNPHVFVFSEDSTFRHECHDVWYSEMCIRESYLYIRYVYPNKNPKDILRIIK